MASNNQPHFKRGDRVSIHGGTYKGRKGTFLKIAGDTGLRARVKVDNDVKDYRVLTLSFLRKIQQQQQQQQPRSTSPRATTTNNDEFQQLIAETRKLREAVEGHDLRGFREDMKELTNVMKDILSALNKLKFN